MNLKQSLIVMGTLQLYLQKQIENTQQQVVLDQRAKITLERELLKELRNINIKTVRQFQRDMLQGTVTRAQDFQPQLQEILGGQYAAVVDEFEGRIASQMPADAAMTDEEKATLTAALTAFFTNRAIQQSQVIMDTTQREMNAAALVASTETANQVERAAIATAIVARRLQARETAIASLETQAAAEAAKSAEFDVLAGKIPLSMETTDESLPKEWATVGDEAVRPAHVMADSQVRPADRPFDVGGEQLMYPGDTSLGATVGNVINCRCSAVYNTTALAAMRIRKSEEPVFDTEISDALRASLG